MLFNIIIFYSIKFKILMSSKNFIKIGKEQADDGTAKIAKLKI
ncbi:MAG TPA: hypothetical protein PLD27_03355 [bacterium]|nr:hypothetical protein [bacterium]HOL48280.1 hypothetical protein [bacterium]HPQ18739.1 hypothetical protein [bacterium]